MCNGISSYIWKNEDYYLDNLYESKVVKRNFKIIYTMSERSMSIFKMSLVREIIFTLIWKIKQLCFKTMIPSGQNSGSTFKRYIYLWDKKKWWGLNFLKRCVLKLL